MKAERWELDLELERMVEAARQHRPAPIDIREARLLVASALDGVGAREKAKKRLFAWAGASVVLMVALAFAFDLLSGNTVVVGPQDRPLRLSLKAGDALVAAPSTELVIVSQALSARKVRVERGAVLFDVTPLSAGQRFEVETAHVSLSVFGTVFTVEVEGARTLVRVYEGRVLVAGAVVEAGNTFSSYGPPPARPSPLDSEARAAVEARRVPEAPGSTPAVLPLQAR